jgi:uroporphyrinogen-III decarboxylase
MTRKERLERTLRGLPVDRPPVSFYEIDGIQDETDPDPFNIYSSPDWKPVLDLARERTDRIVGVQVPIADMPENPVEKISVQTTWIDDGGNKRTRKTIPVGNRILTHRTRRSPGVNTSWTEEHLLKSTDDLKAYLSLPVPVFGGHPDTTNVEALEQELGDAGIVRVDTASPLCVAAGLFDMETFTIIAMTERNLFLRLLERIQSYLQPQIEAISAAFPGRHWRIYGPEYASPPYLPPRLFRDYVTAFDTPMVSAIHDHGGFARLHSHGNLRDILDDIAATGCMGLDPVEPPPQGDVSLSYVRDRVGEQMVLFGNLEACDLENLAPYQFEERIRVALREGPGGRGFVLMPSASPYGRTLTPNVLPNYRAMVRLVEDFRK